MAPVVAVLVVVEFVVFVVVADFKVALRVDAVEEGAVVQDGQVETAAVPADQRRRVFVDALEEALHDFVFAARLVAQRPDFQPLRGFHRDRDGDDFVQVVAHEGAAGLAKALAAHHAVDGGVVQVLRRVVEQAVSGNVGDGFDVEDEDVMNHGGSGEVIHAILNRRKRRSRRSLRCEFYFSG